MAFQTCLDYQGKESAYLVFPGPMIIVSVRIRQRSSGPTFLSGGKLFILTIVILKLKSNIEIVILKLKGKFINEEG